MTLKKILKDEEDTFLLANELVNILKNKIVFLNGDLGVGKTTFVKYYAKAIGFDDDITSPTFSIANNYSAINNSIIHFDLYRINSEEELEMIGFYDMINNKNSTIFIEWAEKFNLQEYINDYIRIDIELIDNDMRQFTLKEVSK